LERWPVTLVAVLTSTLASYQLLLRSSNQTSHSFHWALWL